MNSHLRSSIRAVLLVAAIPAAVQAQTSSSSNPELERVIVTGSRITQTGAEGQQPVFTLDREQIEKTGVVSVGDLLQQLTTSGKALNAKFNSSGNFGYPPDGGGIGAGSAQVDLRNLESKRVLVLVDGIRWVNESSASGVSGSADLNTIPMAIIERIEVLEDGASAIYGSDAIAGVINIITRKKFDGIELNGYFGQYEDGGDTAEASMTVGGSAERLSAIFTASYFDQNEISASKWDQSSVPQPNAGPGAGSSGTPQGRFTFCDPSRPVGQYGSCTSDQQYFYDVTLDSGTATPVWNPADPSSGTYHDFSSADRFNYAPYNLLLTPTQRKSMFTTILYDVTDTTRLHVKALYNNRTSTNQAAPEPIFVGPYASTGGIADTISISAANPYNPFGIDLDPSSNFGWVTRRPVEVGPRMFDQNVDTWYFNVGLEGRWNVGRGLSWDVNYATSENKAEQTFENGYNVAKIKIALGDPTVCAATPGCVPLDLFGGQGRPMTTDMINYIRTRQIDSSTQKLDLVQANISGDMFDIGGRAAGFAAGLEHRRYQGEFNPDPLRQTGESQDSLAFPVSADYDVDELYAEFNFPVLETLDISAAIRYSDYSTFGNETTGKAGFRWEPVESFAFRGTYSTGFRAPNLGELYGLTQFGATLTDPCGPTGSPVVVDADGLDTTPLETACRAQGVPNGFEQANTQITTFTGGNPELQPETSDSYTLGLLYSPSWAVGVAGTQRVDFELTYYHHKIEKAIQAADIQALLDACYAAGGDDPALCDPFTRQPGGNLNPPDNRLDNLGKIETDGIDIKVSWASDEFDWGRLSAALQSTYVNDYKAVDADGNVAQRKVGVEVSDSAIPEWQTNLQLGWGIGSWDATWSLRYISAVKEDCSNASVSDVPGCESGWHELDSTLYNDVQVAWLDAFTVTGLKVALGINNIFGEDPPICYTCSLNGYDAGTYDLPGAFWNLSAKYKF
jgi:iron complex outermembrane recepter protein